MIVQPWETWQPVGGEIAILEAPPGRRRRALLRRILQRAEIDHQARTWLLDCDFRSGGVWSGVQELIASVIEESRLSDESLVRRHDHELLQVLPELQSSISFRFPTLTDLATGEEKVRGYPADRVFRSIHGLIDLLAEWQAQSGRAPWVIACDGYDSASRIGATFFRELSRRRGESLGLSIVVGISPGSGDRFRSSFAVQGPTWLSEEPAEPEMEETVDVSRVWDLDRAIGNDRPLIRKNLAKMIRLWERAGDPERLLKWNLLGLEVCTDGGLYEDARTYGEEARRLAKELKPDDGALRWMIFFKLFSCHLALRATAAALSLAETEALGRTERPEWRAQLDYLMAMLYARYLPEKDFEKAESYLEMGIAELEQASLSEEGRQFRIVFNRNGLAMVRHFQGRYGDAIELCRSSFERLKIHLSEEKHRLHRSVLLYNLGQVYSAMGRLEEAAAYYSDAIAMDSNYSEYYNDRGSLYLRIGAVEEALADYRRAVELSPPYFEVHTNLGQCYRRMGRVADAVREYSRALDLQPDQLLALLGRAQAWEALGRSEEAVSDYTRALTLAPKQWEALANRAILYYQANLLQESLADLDQALEIAPDQADLYQNRAVVRADLGMMGEAIMDLEACLSLRPDQAEVEERLSELRALAGSYVATAAERPASQADRSTA